MNNIEYNLLIGTYTDNCPDTGIYLYKFNAVTASLRRVSHTGGVANPSYLCIDRARNVIYCVNENKASSSISSFHYRESGSAIEGLNIVSSHGQDPCFILQDNFHVFAVNYTSGSIAVYGKKPDGSLTTALQVIQHTGSSIVTKRQDSAHVHMACFSPDKEFIYFTDLGTDKIYIYRYLKNGGTTPLELKDTIHLIPGSGPRHLVFHPGGHFFYVITELAATVDVFSCSGQRPFLLQRAALTPSGNEESKSGGDIHLSVDGMYLYASNRGKANTITVFKVKADGTLNQIQQLPSGGSGPRNFTLDPTGKYLLIAHQNSNTIVIFKRDTTSGLLQTTNKYSTICKPACLVFMTNLPLLSPES
jgi:6-phosphogluconolactonase